MKVDVWSDIACPWCWLGKRHLEEVIRRSGVAGIDVEYHSYELQPGARGVRPVRDHLAERYGDEGGSIDAVHAHLTEAGRAVGLVYDFANALAVNTFDAHRLHHLAKERGLGAPVVDRLMRAHHGEGADLSDRATLRALGIEGGLEAAEVDDVLFSDRYAAAVRAEEVTAQEIGIQGVPFFVFDGKYAVSGAQAVEVFESALAMAVGGPTVPHDGPSESH